MKSRSKSKLTSDLPKNGDTLRRSQFRHGAKKPGFRRLLAPHPPGRLGYLGDGRIVEVESIMALFARANTYNPPAGGSQYYGAASQSLGNVIGSIKDACQGACAGFLSMIGATHLTTEASLFGEIGSDVDFLDRIWNSIAVNGMAGPVELLAGFVMFFAARRTVSRTIGLLVFIGFIAAYSNGYSAAEVLTFASDWLAKLALVLEPISVAENS